MLEVRLLLGVLKNKGFERSSSKSCRKLCRLLAQELPGLFRFLLVSPRSGAVECRPFNYLAAPENPKNVQLARLSPEAGAAETPKRQQDFPPNRGPASGGYWGWRPNWGSPGACCTGGGRAGISRPVGGPERRRSGSCGRTLPSCDAFASCEHSRKVTGVTRRRSS